MTPSRLAGLGAFVIGGILLFAIGLFLIGERRMLFQKKFTVYTEFSRISGLQPGASVASIQTEGIVGGTFLFVNAGTNAAPPVPDDGTIPGREPFELADLMQQMNETVGLVNETIR